jgi:hypothetical protein
LTPRVARCNLCASFQIHLVEVTALEGGETVLHDIHNRALRRAAQILGSEEKLRERLGATETDFSSWATQRELPRNIFLHLVDIITDEEVRNVKAYAAPR